MRPYQTFGQKHCIGTRWYMRFSGFLSKYLPYLIAHRFSWLGLPISLVFSKATFRVVTVKVTDCNFYLLFILFLHSLTLQFLLFLKCQFPFVGNFLFFYFVQLICANQCFCLIKYLLLRYSFLLTRPKLGLQYFSISHFS